MKHGAAIPGIVMATGSFVVKIMMGISTFLATTALTLGHFNAALPVQSAGTQNWIRYSIVAVLLISPLLSLLCNHRLHEFRDSGVL